jgi:phage-related protein
VSPLDKPLVWLVDVIKTPSLSATLRIEAGYLLRCLQHGVTLAMPHARTMPTIGARVFELRLTDGEANAEWRIIYRIDPDAIIIVHCFQKKTQKTPKSVLDLCVKRLSEFDQVARSK